MLFNIENTEKYKKISLLGLKINIKKKPTINDIRVINERLNEIQDNMKVINEILNLENKIVFTKIYKDCWQHLPHKSLNESRIRYIHSNIDCVNSILNFFNKMALLL